MPMGFKRAAATSEEDDYSYIDKSSDRQLVFTPQPNEVVVTFHDRLSDTVLNKLTQALPLTISQGFNVGRGVVAVQTATSVDLASAVRSLREQLNVANALPVMIGPDGLRRYFLPDELTVQFEHGVEREQAERIIEHHGSWVIAEQRTPGFYTIAVPESSGLFETIHEFSDLPEVAFAEPSEGSFSPTVR